MDVKSIEISKSLLELLKSLPENEIEGFVDTLRFNVAKRANGDAAGLATDDGTIAISVLHGEDNTLTLLALEADAD